MNKFNFPFFPLKHRTNYLISLFYLRSEVEYDSNNKQQYYREKCNDLFKSLCVSSNRDLLMLGIFFDFFIILFIYF